MKMLIKNGVAACKLPDSFVATFAPNGCLIVHHPVTGEPELCGEFVESDFNSGVCEIAQAGELPEDYENKKYLFDKTTYTPNPDYNVGA